MRRRAASPRDSDVATIKTARRAVATAVVVIAAACALAPVLKAHPQHRPARIAFVDNAVINDPVARREFDSAYRRISTEASDGRAPSELWAPHYREREADGTMSGKMEVEATVEGNLDNLMTFDFRNFQDTMTLESVAVDGNRAVANYEVHELVQDGPPQVVDDQTCQDVWTERSGSWRIAMTNVIEDTYRVGGKVIQHLWDK